MKQIIVAIMLLSFSVAALALSPDVLWTASDTKLINNAARTGVPPVVQLELNDSGEMLLNWTEITGTTGYNVYHADAPEPIDSDAWTPLATLPPETLSYMVAPDQTRGFFYVTSTQVDGPPMPANFVFVAGGTIDSSNSGFDDLTVEDFYIDKYQLTQEKYMSVMGTWDGGPNGHGVGADYPVYTVSWFNAIEYCNRLSIDEELTPCYSYTGSVSTNPDTWPDGWNTSDANALNVTCDFSATGYRLPTAVEWEYAARGGLQTQDYTYSGSNTINEVAWYYGTNDPFGSKPVGTKAPNELGIYDMSGNVWEWNWSLTSNVTSTNRVVRGGSWGSSANQCGLRMQNSNQPTHPGNQHGFRLCRSSP